MSAWNCEGCGSEVIGKIRRGRCDPCYRKQLKQQRALGADLGAPPRKYRPRKKVAPKVTSVERIFGRTTPGWGGCILFTGRLSSESYGLAKVAGRTLTVHRHIYLTVVGPVPEGMVLDHICHTTDLNCPGGTACLHRRCVNPRHLEPVTAVENNLRGRGLSATNFFKVECVRGHPFTPENTMLTKRRRSDGLPQRQCRQCHREGTRRWSERARSRR